MENKKKKANSFTDKRNKNSYIKLIIFILLLAVGTVMYITELRNNASEEGTIEIHIIDVGQGDCVLVKTDAGNLLIDAGTNDSEYALAAYLDSVGVKDFEYCIFTHPHEDHIGGADMIIDDYNVRNVIMSPASSTLYTYERLLDSLERSEANVIEAVPDSIFNIGELEIFIMAPIVLDEEHSLNNQSVVTRLTFGERRFLFTGDAEVIEELDILDKYDIGDLKCDFLKMGHHGSSTSSCDEFIDAVDPYLAAISCGKNNDYGHPHREIVALLGEREIEYTRTDFDGSSVYVSDGESIWRK